MELKLIRQCPKCKADRKEVHDSLHQTGENHDLALAIIQNCEPCALEVAEAERRLQRIEAGVVV